MSSPTTSRTTAVTGGGGTGAVLALATAEVRLLIRNRTAAVSAVLLPVLFGLFFAWTFNPTDGNSWGSVLALQLAFSIGMTVYVTVTQTVVARRQSGVLKRFRTSSLSDRGILTATTAPAIAVTLVHLVAFAAFNPVIGAPLPVDYLSLALALVSGIALAVAAAFATAVVTTSAERAQITTLPLFLVMLTAAIVVPLMPVDSPLQVLALVPGAALGQFASFAMVGGAWAPGVLGLPAILPGLVATVLWPVVFAALARPRFRWDARD